MKQLLFFCAQLLLVFTLVGCQTTHMHIVESPQIEQVPADKASITFFRYSSFDGGIIQTPIAEFKSNNVEFVGITSVNTKIRHIVEPGEHTWVLGGEGGSLIKANLLAGKNYYVRIDTYEGWWKRRFYGKAMSPEMLATEKIQKQLKVCDYVEISATGPQWFLENKLSMFDKVSVGMEKWNDMDADERCYVDPSYGVDDIY